MCFYAILLNDANNAKPIKLKFSSKNVICTNYNIGRFSLYDKQLHLSFNHLFNVIYSLLCSYSFNQTSYTI